MGKTSLDSVKVDGASNFFGLMRIISGRVRDINKVVCRLSQNGKMAMTVSIGPNCSKF